MTSEEWGWRLYPRARRRTPPPLPPTDPTDRAAAFDRDAIARLAERRYRDAIA